MAMVFGGAQASGRAPSSSGGSGAAGGISDGSSPTGGHSAAGAPTPAIGINVNGGYVAAGVGLRNRGAGTIALSGIPVGATVQAAYLYWSILGGAAEPANFKAGKLKGKAITGTKIGTGGTPCWNEATTGYAYRATVTSLVTGNGNYALSGFASGVTTGVDPFLTSPQVPPLAEGASLVVVYKKASYPLTKVVISNGCGLVKDAAGLTASIPFGFAASKPVVRCGRRSSAVTVRRTSPSPRAR